MRVSLLLKLVSSVGFVISFTARSVIMWEYSTTSFLCRLSSWSWMILGH
ncbi:hypothetical protein LINPERHAP1_LOCUS33616 [Linum perenne]